MGSLVAHDKIQPDYKYDEIGIGDRSIPKYATTKLLKALSYTLNFIDTRLKLFPDNYDARCDAYVNAMKDMFNQIPQTMSQPLTIKQKFQKLMIYIGGGWYMEKIAKRLPPLKRSKISKKTRDVG